QFVVTGDPWAVERAIGELRPLALRAELLPMGWAMHSPRLTGVTDSVAEHVARRVGVRAPESARLYAPMPGGRAPDAAAAAEVLARQVARPSRWDATLREIGLAGYRRFAEIGPGDVLAKLLRWTLRDARAAVVEDPESIEALAAAAPAPASAGEKD